MKIKRIVSVAATFVMALGLFTGCGAASTDTTTTTANNNTTAVQDTVKATESDSTIAQTTPSSGKKTLVVYYSATGSTKTVAQTIAENADADIFEISPVNPYTSDDLNWTNNNSRVSKEHNDESLRNVELTKVTPDNWDSYDTVLIGYPIWWGIAAWPVDTFVKVMISQARQSFHSVHQLHQDLVTVEQDYRSWQEQVTGRLDRDSVQEPLHQKFLSGLSL